MRRFLFRLAGHLGMTVRELSRRMDSQELSEWVAFTRYYHALPDPWQQTGLLTSAVLAPYSEKGKAPKASDFVPTEKPPQTSEEMAQELAKLAGIFEQ
jgi:hypothetical protein